MMMNDEQVLALYESVSELTGKMLAAAQSGNWDHLAELESRCASHVQVLREGEAVVVLSGERRAHKVAMLRKILADDRAIRDITLPWMAKLSTLLQSSSVERRVATAYASPAF